MRDASSATPAEIAVRMLGAREAAAWAPLTFPAHRDLVTDPPDREMVYVGAAGNDGTPVGLAFGMGGPNGDFEMFSVHVLPFWRRHGVGRALLDTLCDAFATRGYRRAVHFFTVDAEEQGFARFLMRCGWAKPWVRQLVCRTDLTRASQTPWLVRAAIPEGYEVIAWHAAGDPARDALKSRKANDPALFPDALDPFSFEADFDAATSVALMRDGDIVGWVITHPLDEDTLRWTCSWVLDPLQGAARIVPLWWQVAQRQRATSSREKFIWTIPMEQPRMTRFATRRMRPWLAGLGYACTSVRDLD